MGTGRWGRDPHPWTRRLLLSSADLHTGKF
nr:MAG TPA: hypothetical protein [Caudoviricetes sp.]